MTLRALYKIRNPYTPGPDCPPRKLSMALSQPVLLFDNDCGVCSRFAFLAMKSSKGWVRPVGLFTKQGAHIKSAFFSPNDRPDEMFWLLLGDTGYGGRCGLLPLAREIIRGLVI